MPWCSPRLPVRPGCRGARVIERLPRTQHKAMLVCRYQVAWRDQWGPTPRCEHSNASGRPDRVSVRWDAGLGGRFRSYRIHHSNDSVLGPAVRALQPLHLATVAVGDSPHGTRGGAGPAPNTRHEVHSTPFSLRPLASHNQQSALKPHTAAHDVAEEEAPGFSLSKGDPAVNCAHPCVHWCRYSPRTRCLHELPARSSDRKSGRYWVRTSDLSRVKRALYH